MTFDSYIEVAVTLPVNQAFVYEAPDALEGDCVPGMRVLVPFGRRRVTGYILGRKKTCGGFKTKKILDILDDHPLFPQGEIAFFKWVADYYLHPLGETIKAALPAGLDRQDVSCVFAAQAGKEALAAGTLTPGEARVIEAAGVKDGISLKQLVRSSGNPSIRSLIRKMEQSGLISVSAVLKKEAASVRQETFVRKTGRPPNPGQRLSKKRQEILAVLEDTKGISLTALREKVPTAPRLLKPLSEDGLVTLEKRRVFRDPLGDPVEPDTPPELTPEQARVVETVTCSMEKGFVPYLLSGVTGSGKTEVYMRLVQAAMDAGKNAIVLVPEIALISQTERRFRARFGERIAVLHSMLTHGERLDQWRRIALGKVRVVIGARSALFAPFDGIGMIIVDEEHDSSYKQETGLRYNARDLAVVRAKMNRCPVVLGSATPSVQSFQNVRAGRFEQLTLRKRVNNHPLPEIILVDLKKYKDAKPVDRIITPELAREIRSCLEKGNQALIFLNRRGFASFPSCKACDKPLNCRYCDVIMTFHRSSAHYKCHLCGYVLPEPAVCPECGQKRIQNFGFGTEKIEDMLKEMFPDARLARMDQDSTAKKGSALKLLKSIRNRTVDLIVGTQMLAKGHDFPAITLVGVVCADLSMNLPDFRASERTFQLLAQVAGRAGRGSEPGRVIMQTYTPDHFTIEASRHQDYVEFFDQEAPFRKALRYPPFTRMVQLKISGREEKKVEGHARRAAEVLVHLLASEPDGTEPAEILGPIEAPIHRISARFRWQILVKCPSFAKLRHLVKTLMDHPDIKANKTIAIAIDVDPYFLM